jgi:hypothetical protein
MLIDNPLIGTDIEVFIQDENSKKFLSAAGDEKSQFMPLIPGSKDFPYLITEDKYFGIQVDNVSAEFTVPPARTCTAFRDSILFMLKYLKDYLPIGYVPVPKASQIFDEDQLQTPIAMTFGCDRDLNAWTKRFNPKPNTNTNLRSNGFHIHIGYDKPSKAVSVELIKAMDLYVGLASLNLDADTQRRQLYGRAGSFRFKPYGVEYRVLSSALVADPANIDFIYEATQKAIDFVNLGLKIDPSLAPKIQEAINTSNAEAVEGIFAEFNNIYNVVTTKEKQLA